MTLANASPTGRLSDDDLEAERAKLETWCRPQEFHNMVDALAAKVSLEDLFNVPRLAFLRDAILLAEFALKLGGVKSVRLATKFDQFPDGFVTTQDNKTLKVEVTEADLEKRLAELARNQNKSVMRVKADLQKEGRLESVRQQVREEKTLDLLLSRANITPMPKTGFSAASPTESQP